MRAKFRYEINQLSPQAEVLFYRLITFADDYGLFKSDPKILNGALFSLKDFRESQVILWIDELAKVGLIRLYLGADLKPYGLFVNWEKHQSVRNTKTKYPEAEVPYETFFPSIIDLMKAVEISCMQLKSIECNCVFNPIQSESNPNPNKSSELCESSKPPPDVVVEIPLVHKRKDGGPEMHPVGQTEIDEWSESFPAVDVLQELKALREWNISNARKRKSRTGIRKHITSWLSRAQDRAGSRRSPPQGARGRITLEERNRIAAEEFLNDDR